MSPGSEYFNFLISSLFISGSIVFLGMIQNLLPVASESETVPELHTFHPTLLLRMLEND